ncbi:hypothetical protein MMC2321_02623 [Chitinophaga sp. MM2321]
MSGYDYGHVLVIVDEVSLNKKNGKAIAPSFIARTRKTYRYKRCD